jgi:hypothetical protein
MILFKVLTKKFVKDDTSQFQNFRVNFNRFHTLFLRDYHNLARLSQVLCKIQMQTLLYCKINPFSTAEGTCIIFQYSLYFSVHIFWFPSGVMPSWKICFIWSCNHMYVMHWLCQHSVYLVSSAFKGDDNLLWVLVSNTGVRGLLWKVPWLLQPLPEMNVDVLLQCKEMPMDSIWHHFHLMAVF